MVNTLFWKQRGLVRLHHGAEGGRGNDKKDRGVAKVEKFLIFYPQFGKCLDLLVVWFRSLCKG